jgi:PleD family two-component response regulator
MQRSLMHQQLAAAARTDPKTGLLNATAWQREADTEVARAQRTGSPLALLLVDVDHFKRVNDSHGHLIGDEVLRALATELRQQARESDVVGRFGGEEFTVLLPRTDGAGAYGIAVLGQHGNDLFELLAAADVALYRAKDADRDRVRIYAHATGNATENKDEATDACP